MEFLRLISMFLEMQTHHKEICLAVDTAKFIVSSFPTTAQLVVGGIPRDFQPSMGEMLDIVSTAKSTSIADVAEGRGTKCLVLFPTEDARTFEDIVRRFSDEMQKHIKVNEKSPVGPDPKSQTEPFHRGWNVIVIDGTWSQARKMHAKYFPDESSGMLFRVQLSGDVVENLDRLCSDVTSEEEQSAPGLQLRRHPIKVRAFWCCL